MATLSSKLASFGPAPMARGSAKPGAQTIRGQLARHAAVVEAALAGRPAAPPAALPSASAFLVARCLNLVDSAVCDLRNQTAKRIAEQLQRHAGTACCVASGRFLDGAGHGALAASFRAAFAPLGAGDLFAAQRTRQAQVAALRTRILSEVADGPGTDALNASCLPRAPRKPARPTAKPRQRGARPAARPAAAP